MPFHLLLLLLLSDRSECLTVGLEIIAAFPQNLAYYHPSLPENQLRIIALHDDTQVTIMSTFADGSEYTDSALLRSGEIREFPINASVELDNNPTSVQMVAVTSNKEVAVESLSLRSNSIQTALLLPTDQLAVEYQIPPFPQIENTSPVAVDASRDTTNAETESNPFKLIIVNSKETNTISLSANEDEDFVLDPGQVMQLSVYEDMVGTLVTGSSPFLALFGQSCAIKFDCTCGMLYTPLQPYTSDKQKFIVPPVFSDEAEESTYLLSPSESEPLQFTSGGSFEVSGPLVLHRPGLLLNLIPEEEFGSCFAVHTVSIATKNWAVIVAPAASTGDVQIGQSPVEGDWTPISGTDFKYIKVELTSMTSIIWHKSGPIAVWFLGKKDEGNNAWFGNPAARLSTHPDPRGCVLEPERLEIVEKEGTWQEAIQACRNRSLALISLSDQTLQNYIYSRMMELMKNLDLMELWMGLRRISFSGKWSWISKEPLRHVGWSQGYTGEVAHEHCARISLEDAENPGWVHRDCCSPAKAVCYQPPKLLTI